VVIWCWLLWWRSGGGVVMLLVVAWCCDAGDGALVLLLPLLQCELTPLSSLYCPWPWIGNHVLCLVLIYGAAMNLLLTVVSHMGWFNHPNTHMVSVILLLMKNEYALLYTQVFQLYSIYLCTCLGLRSYYDRVVLYFNEDIKIQVLLVVVVSHFGWSNHPEIVWLFVRMK
jgi:hypothetical protein